MAKASVGEAEQDGHQVTVLGSADGELEAAFAIGVGMIGCSLRHRGDELLGMRGGLRKYAETGSSFGIPLLHPWANRLSGFAYRVAGREVELDPGTGPLRLDEHGLPIHGLLAASPHWEVVESEADAQSARLVAHLDFAAHRELLAGFPFPHLLEQEVVVQRGRLAVGTTVRAGDRPVPISFGYHPYLRLPGVPRERWEVTLPVGRRAVLDARGIPTGDSEPVDFQTGPLGERTFDDLFDELDEPAAFVLAGGGRRIEVGFDAAYRFAQVYAPPGQDFICFEPMTAPTNALVSGDRLELVQPGGAYAAAFSIAVT
jgi:aldose 1-epimerase